MVDVHTTNEKLRLRARRILREAAGVTDEVAAALTSGRVREAVAALARARDGR
jgi:N-acetylmuramic acid 6-phosphate (MurNAc-6-P) etherase